MAAKKRRKRKKAMTWANMLGSLESGSFKIIDSVRSPSKKKRRRRTKHKKSR